MRFNFKKISAIATSALMIGMTAGVAAAANYPAPFVVGGSADAAIVYGTGTGVSVLDAIEAGNIQTSLNSFVTSSGGGTPTGGDYVKLAKTSDNLNLNNLISTVYGSTLTEDDLPELLVDGIYKNDENTEYKYDQRIVLGTGLLLNYFSDSDYKDRIPTIGINLTSSQLVVNYTLDFSTDAASDVTSGDLVDLENTNINFLGRNYFISDADNSTLDLTLLDSSTSAIVAEGETKTLALGGTSYDVSINWIDSSKVILTVNGEDTNTLSKGETYKLSDGTYVGIKEILARDVTGIISKAEFSLGTGKLELKNGNSIKLNDKTITPVVYVATRGSSSGGKTSIDKIGIYWTTDVDEFITPEQSLTLPGLESVKFSMNDITTGVEEETMVQAGGGDYAHIKTEFKDGSVTIPILYANSSGEFAGIGKSSSEGLIAINDTKMVYNYTRGDRYFVTSWNSSSDSESYFLRLQFSASDGINYTTVQKNVEGNWETVCEDRKIGDTCSLGSVTLTVDAMSSRLGNDRAVNLSTSGTNFNIAYTKSGMKFFLPWTNRSDQTMVIDRFVAGHGMDGFINISGQGAAGAGLAGHRTGDYAIMFIEEDKNDGVALGSYFNVTVDDNSNGEVDISGFANGKGSITDPEDSNHITSRAYSDLGTFMERTGQSSDQRVVNVKYAGEEIYADVFLASSTATSGGSGSMGEMLVKDNEIASVGSKNLVIVGGSCINSAAASLVGGTYCGAAWTSSTGVGSGQFLIKGYSSSGITTKLALLVAGYEAADTVNGATYLRTQTVDTSESYIGTSSTSASLVTTQA